jgi:transmembrane 9 superfamily protein 3
MKFKSDISSRKYCEITLEKSKLDQMVYAVEHHYWYQMYIDDLPIWGVVGEIPKTDDDKKPEHLYIWTHKKFEIGYNGDRIVDVSMTSENKQKLVEGMVIPFTYEVIWTGKLATVDSLINWCF